MTDTNRFQPSPPSVPDKELPSSERRTTLGLLTVGLIGSLTLAYGSLAAVLGRFLFPARRFPRRWLYVAEVAGFSSGEALAYRLPDDQPVTVARLGDTGGAEDFLALSSTCPHLGCRVLWQAQHDRFFCPCHNGVFTPQGVAISGPPADAGQSLPQFPLKIANGLLFIEVPINQLADGNQTSATALQRDRRAPSKPGVSPGACGGEPRRRA